MHECSVCTKETTLTCRGCHSTYYCGKKCQEDDWRSHQIICEANNTNNTNTTTNKFDTCAVCSKQTTSVCGRCEEVLYCSKKCLKIGWKTGHKSVCKDSKIFQSENTLFEHLNNEVATDIDFKFEPSSSLSMQNVSPNRYFNNINEIEFDLSIPLPPHMQYVQQLVASFENCNKDGDDEEIIEQNDIHSIDDYHCEEFNDEDKIPLCSDANQFLELSRRCNSPICCDNKIKTKKRTDKDIKSLVYEQPFMEFWV